LHRYNSRPAPLSPQFISRVLRPHSFESFFFELFFFAFYLASWAGTAFFSLSFFETSPMKSHVLLPLVYPTSPASLEAYGPVFLCSLSSARLLTHVKLPSSLPVPRRSSFFSNELPLRTFWLCLECPPCLYFCSVPVSRFFS